mmetsp:Transcript_11655/g.28043  ORF Transcript_11655/g.28043 Transcript_11655/m.28043 type:complete len:231 (-) Transcript_11655:299-991(-)
MDTRLQGSLLKQWSPYQPSSRLALTQSFMSRMASSRVSGSMVSFQSLKSKGVESIQSNSPSPFLAARLRPIQQASLSSKPGIAMSGKRSSSAWTSVGTRSARSSPLRASLMSPNGRRANASSTPEGRTAFANALVSVLAADSAVRRRWMIACSSALSTDASVAMRPNGDTLSAARCALYASALASWRSTVWSPTIRVMPSFDACSPSAFVFTPRLKSMLPKHLVLSSVGM